MQRRSLVSASLVAGFVTVAVVVALVVPRGRPAAAAHRGKTVNLSLNLPSPSDAIPPLTLVGDDPRHLQEIDIVTTTPPSPVDDGIAPLVQASESSSLDWSGVQLVEEEWRPDGTGKFQRQRFYRGAAWMKRPSVFKVVPTDDAGMELGPPMIAHAGKDDKWIPSDDGFVRRFVVRQIASGCLAVGNCTGATFVVQGLAQWRAALHAETDARQIPVGTTKLRVEWSEQPLFPRMIPVRRLPASAFPFGYGFQPSVEVVNPPANGSFYMPGEPLSVRVTFRDGAGKRLHPEGSLPSYGEFLRGEVASGLRYFDNFRINPTLYYALKHREGNLLVTLSGPSDRLKTPTRTVPVSDFFAPEITAAAVPDDGWSGTASGFPPFSILLGGLVDPSVWETPLSDTLTLTVPSDARPGTYVLAVKARRDFAGEALNRAATTNIQVGTATPTTFLATTGPCNTCHSGPSDTENVLHGVSDRRACYSCHASLETEPDAALDIRVHWVHDRSGRYRSVGGNIRNCAQCHLTPPDGPARGLLIP